MNRRLTPPPRVVPRAEDNGRKGGGRIGLKTLAAFALLGALAVYVFAYLPPSTNVEGGTGVTTKPVEAAEAESSPEANPTPKAVAPQPKAEPRPKPAEPKPEPPPQPEPNSKPAPIDATEVEFTRAMSEGMTALNAQDFARAKTSFERAQGLRPESREARDALAQADERLRLDAIASHRERGAAFESEEAWRRAEAEYDRALALEPTLQFARTGKQRTQARAELAEAMAFHITHPERLSEQDVLDEAANVIRKAEAVPEPTGARHREQLARLRHLVDAYARAVTVTLRSDGLTEVTLYRVGRLGSFESRNLELRPGRYTAIGSRDGYRDVRRQLVIEPGKVPAPLVVVCEEPIR